MIRAFIREYRSWFLAYFVQAFAFFLVFWLYQLPLGYFFYSLLFSAVIWLALVLHQAVSFVKRLKAIQVLHEMEWADTYALRKPVDRFFLAKMKELEEARDQTILAYKKREQERQTVVKMWAHQLKVPLAALSLMEQTESIDRMNLRSQVLSMNHYLANLLNYLRLSDQISDYRFTKVSVRSLMVDLVKQYRVHFLQKDLSVSIEGDWEVKTDSKWLSFALSQILDNATKYSRNGGAIRIQMREGEILIEDSGSGILPEDLPRLFEQGFTGFNGREHQKATGLGLYMTKQILDNLELAIQVESQLDVGTKVYVTKIM